MSARVLTVPQHLTSVWSWVKGLQGKNNCSLALAAEVLHPMRGLHQAAVDKAGATTVAVAHRAGDAMARQAQAALVSSGMDRPTYRRNEPAHPPLASRLQVLLVQHLALRHYRIDLPLSQSRDAAVVHLH